MASVRATERQLRSQFHAKSEPISPPMLEAPVHGSVAADLSPPTNFGAAAHHGAQQRLASCEQSRRIETSCGEKVYRAAGGVQQQQHRQQNDKELAAFASHCGKPRERGDNDSRPINGGHGHGCHAASQQLATTGAPPPLPHGGPAGCRREGGERRKKESHKASHECVHGLVEYREKKTSRTRTEASQHRAQQTSRANVEKYDGRRQKTVSRGGR